MLRIAPTISKRHIVAEVMDDPDLEARRHIQALNGLARLNRFSRSVDPLWKPIQAMIRRDTLSQVSVLDVACGAGDNLVRVDRLARRAGMQVSLTGCDVSTLALRHATNRSESARAHVNWYQHDILTDELPQKYDVVMCSLFVHHLSHEEQAQLLGHIKESARRMVIVVDLERCRVGYLLAMIASQLLTRSDVVHTDALRSVAAALTIPEAEDLFESEGLHAVRVRRCWPFRWVATWERGPA